MSPSITSEGLSNCICAACNKRIKYNTPCKKKLFAFGQTEGYPSLSLAGGPSGFIWNEQVIDVLLPDSPVDVISSQPVPGCACARESPMVLCARALEWLAMCFMLRYPSPPALHPPLLEELSSRRMRRKPTQLSGIFQVGFLVMAPSARERTRWEKGEASRRRETKTAEAGSTSYRVMLW